ncbi:metal-dependent hydrolase [Burkholderia sp. Nafp2/4-1b]|uniref:metal-dependent hydrolase n=1 Tax=Burkholderia sp. Nafp2/4-1b TaxID=2116686 RepID=UPI000EF90D41|nr:metal-dependent hydrolase [Burkholderia sp. Nafp2/4-1b]RKT98985.1 metal-dependent hydrolase [Burkholderia sp. Nafp2/4-1b]
MTTLQSGNVPERIGRALSRDGVSTKRRGPQFDFAQSNFARWNRDGPVASNFFNALSLFFPAGEKFFIHSVRCFCAKVSDPFLMAEIRKFISQEANHSSEHRSYLKAMERQGYVIEQLDIRMFSRPLNTVDPVWRLAMTVAMEHFTASLSRFFLQDGRVGGDPALTKLWLWHGCEELEHQSVAFDVYRKVIGEGPYAYWLRVAGAIRVTSNFLPRLTSNFVALLSQDLECTRPICYLKAMYYMWVHPGILRRLILDFIGYFRPRFHPSEQQEHDETLVATVRTSLGISDAT